MPQPNPRAAPELSCSHTKLSVFMECLEGVCHESVANTTNQESWLAEEKTLTLSSWLEEVEGPWDVESRRLIPGEQNRELPANRRRRRAHTFQDEQCCPC